jgi:hypothetical protein
MFPENYVVTVRYITFKHGEKWKLKKEKLSSCLCNYPAIVRLVFAIWMEASVPKRPAPTPPTHSQCWHCRRAFGTQWAFETSPEVLRWFYRTWRSRQECTDATLTARGQVLVPCSYKVNPVTSGHTFEVSNPCFCVCSGCTSSCAAGVQYLEICYARRHKCFYQITSQLQKA